MAEKALAKQHRNAWQRLMEWLNEKPAANSNTLHDIPDQLEAIRERINQAITPSEGIELAEQMATLHSEAAEAGQQSLQKGLKKITKHLDAIEERIGKMQSNKERADLKMEAEKDAELVAIYQAASERAQESIEQLQARQVKALIYLRGIFKLYQVLNQTIEGNHDTAIDNGTARLKKVLNALRFLNEVETEANEVEIRTREEMAEIERDIHQTSPELLAALRSAAEAYVDIISKTIIALDTGVGKLSADIVGIEASADVLRLPSMAEDTLAEVGMETEDDPEEIMAIKRELIAEVRGVIGSTTKKTPRKASAHTKGYAKIDAEKKSTKRVIGLIRAHEDITSDELVKIIERKVGFFKKDLAQLTLAILQHPNTNRAVLLALIQRKWITKWVKTNGDAALAIAEHEEADEVIWSAVMQHIVPIARAGYKIASTTSNQKDEEFRAFGSRIGWAILKEGISERAKAQVLRRLLFNWEQEPKNMKIETGQSTMLTRYDYKTVKGNDIHGNTTYNESHTKVQPYYIKTIKIKYAIMKRCLESDLKSPEVAEIAVKWIAQTIGNYPCDHKKTGESNLYRERWHALKETWKPITLLRDLERTLAIAIDRTPTVATEDIERIWGNLWSGQKRLIKSLVRHRSTPMRYVRWAQGNTDLMQDPEIRAAMLVNPNLPASMREEIKLKEDEVEA